mgnify:FL=1
MARERRTLIRQRSSAYCAHGIISYALNKVCWTFARPLANSYECAAAVALADFLFLEGLLCVCNQMRH